MAGTAGAALAAAVSEAGGFGMIGGTSGGGPDWLRAQIRAAREHTARPFGVGFISSFPDIDDLVQVALDEHVAAINHSFADPAPYVAAAHVTGVKVFAQVQTVAGAAAAAHAGVDLIIAQGTVYDLVRAAPFPDGVADRVLRNAFTATCMGVKPRLRGSVRSCSASSLTQGSVVT